MGHHSSTRYTNAPGGAYEHSRRYEATRRAVVEAAQVERAATDHLAAAISAAYVEGHSIREIARMTGVSKSRVDRLNFKQQRLDV